MAHRKLQSLLDSLGKGLPDADHLPGEDLHAAPKTPRVVPVILPATEPQPPIHAALHPTPGPETAPMAEVEKLRARLGSALQIDAEPVEPDQLEKGATAPVNEKREPVVPAIVRKHNDSAAPSGPKTIIEDPYAEKDKRSKLDDPSKIRGKSPAGQSTQPRVAPESRPVIAPNPSRSPKKTTDNTPWLVRGAVFAALMAALTFTSRSCKQANLREAIGDVLEMADININRRLKEELAALEKAPGVPETKKHVVLSGTDPSHPIKIYPGYFTNTVNFESDRPNPIGISFSNLHSNGSAYIFYQQDKKTLLLLMNNNESQDDPCSCSGKGCLECIDKYSGNDDAKLRLEYTLIEGQLDENGNIISAKHRPLVKSVPEGSFEPLESQLNLGMFEAPDKSQWQPLLIPETLATLNKLHHLYITKKNQPKEEKIDGPKPIQEIPIIVPPRFNRDQWARQRFIALVRSPHLCPMSGGRCLDCRPVEDGKSKSQQYTKNRISCANAAAERVDFEIKNGGRITLGGGRILDCRDRTNKNKCDQYWQDRSNGKTVIDGDF